jgi:hypothetical protein
MNRRIRNTDFPLGRDGRARNAVARAIQAATPQMQSHWLRVAKMLDTDTQLDADLRALRNQE